MGTIGTVSTNVKRTPIPCWRHAN